MVFDVDAAHSRCFWVGWKRVGFATPMSAIYANIETFLNNKYYDR